jgi:hypothetical protein
VENFTGAIGTVIFVAYLSALCKSPLHTATQFALLTALAAVGRTYLSSGAGYLAQATGWPMFFVHQRRGRDSRACCCCGGCRCAGTSWACSRRCCRRTIEALADRRRQRALVEIVEFAADRHAVREPRHLHVGAASRSVM